MKQYKLTKQRNHLPMIRELIITDKDVRGKYRNHEYSQHFIIISFSHLSFTPLFPLFLSSLLYLIISPVPTCLVHNCETSRRSFIFSFVITFVLWSIPFDPHQCNRRASLQMLLGWAFTLIRANKVKSDRWWFSHVVNSQSIWWLDTRVLVSQIDQIVVFHWHYLE